MSPFRNPFARRPGAAAAATEEKVPSEGADFQKGFLRVDTTGFKTSSSSLSIHSGSSGRSFDTGDYKMSVVNDSGVYLPPSPTFEKDLWPRQYDSSRTSTDTTSSIGDIEPFSISRESFDSYQRSFDISARSPVLHEATTRASFDSCLLPRLGTPALERQPHHRHGTEPFLSTETSTQEEFEEVGLEDKAPDAQAPPRRKGFFFKFTSASTTTATTDGQSGSSWWVIGGSRKHAASSAWLGNELKPMDTPAKSTVEGDDDEREETASTKPLMPAPMQK